MNSKFLLTSFILLASTFLWASPTLAGECAHIEAYVMNLATSQGISSAEVKIRCQGTFVAFVNGQNVTFPCEGDNFVKYGNCWENSGWLPVSSTGHVVFPDGYDCMAASPNPNPILEVRGIPSGYTKTCATDGSKYNCNDGTNVDTENLQVINGGQYVFKVFYTPPAIPPTPTPIFTPTPTSFNQPTPTPTRIPTPTPTTRPTNTPTPIFTPTPTTPYPTATPYPTTTPQLTPTTIPPTGAPTSTPYPTIPVITKIYYQPTPTPVVLKKAGTETPTIVITVIGTILIIAGLVIAL